LKILFSDFIKKNKLKHISDNITNNPNEILILKIANIDDIKKLKRKNKTKDNEFEILKLNARLKPIDVNKIKENIWIDKAIGNKLSRDSTLKSNFVTALKIIGTKIIYCMYKKFKFLIFDFIVVLFY
jgi:hypothetical protein